MPEIYNELHPYYSPGDGRYKSSSFMHKIIFGEGLNTSFPERLHILTHHSSNWFHMCAEWSNKRSEDYFEDIVSLGEFIRTHMVGDVFITENRVEYHHPEGEHRSSYKNKYEDYFKTDSNGKLIRLPVNCIINYISIHFRNEVDKTQFQLMNDGQYRFMEELEIDRLKKMQDTYRDTTRNIPCPICKVNYDGEHNKNKNI